MCPAGSYVPSILLVAAVLMLGGVLALSYRWDYGQQPHYSNLGTDTPAAVTAADGSGQGSSKQWAAGVSQLMREQQQRHRPHTKQQQQQQQPELELLRGSLPASQFSSSSR